MDQTSYGTESAIVKCDIQIVKEVHQIMLKVYNVSKLQMCSRILSQNLFLGHNCTVNVGFEKDSSNLFVYISNKSEAKIGIERTIVLLDWNNKKLHEESDKNIFSIDIGDEMDVIGRIKNRSSYDTLTNDTLIIDLSVSIKEFTLKQRMRRFIRDADPLVKLTEDFKAMLDNPVNSDVSLQVGDQQIPAHWSILCSRSPYFRKMFESEMLERVENTVTITDLSFSTVKTLVEFLYTADFVVKDNLQELFDLYCAADKYEVMDLRSVCAVKIMDYANPSNVCQILQLAHAHNDNELKLEAMDVMTLDAQAVFQTEGWKKFKSNEPLAADVFIFCLNKK